MCGYRAYTLVQFARVLLIKRACSEEETSWNTINGFSFLVSLEVDIIKYCSMVLQERLKPRVVASDATCSLPQLPNEIIHRIVSLADENLILETKAKYRTCAFQVSGWLAR